MLYSILEDIILPLGICVGLPVLIVWLVGRSKSHAIDRKTEIFLKAIENGVDIDPKLLGDMGRAGKPLKLRLLNKLQTGVVMNLAGLLLLIAGLFVCEDSEAYMGFMITGGISVAIGVGFLVSFFFSRSVCV